MNDGKVLALYDFASKQSYIYRTSKVKEISGASALLSGIYRKFAEIIKDEIVLNYSLGDEFSVSAFEGGKADGEVLYDGGGNLLVLWKSFDKYKRANEIFTAWLLVNAPGLTLITSYVPYTGLFDDKKDSGEEGDRTKLYRENNRRKNLYPASDLSSVMPFTQIDPMTFMPVTYKRSGGSKSVYPASECSLSSDRLAKASNYQAEDIFDSINEGKLAVIYIDGNSMGKKLISCQSESYDDGVKKLRSFSKQVNDNYVVKPVEAIKAKGYEFRQIIGGGDEITLICKAEEALKIMKVYFDTLKEEKIALPGQDYSCSSCAGISVFHAKSPFNVAYDIAEACCEFAKEKAHKDDGNWFCFYYCHSGITNVFKVLHNNEQSHASGKPYSYDKDMDKIADLKKRLNAAGRANVKELGNAAQQGPERFKFELMRVNAYIKDNESKFSEQTDQEETMKMVYDMAEFYDLWFAKGDKEA